ncbi:MAG: S8 family serine peptidase [Jatrophihabitans sp.]
MNFRATLAVGVLVAASVAPGFAVEPAWAGSNDPCDVKAGLKNLPDLWPQKRLDYTRAWTVTRGAHVLVAVIDSGLNQQFDSQLQRMHERPGTDVIGGTFTASDTRDCYGHGTEVTSIVAAAPGSNNFSGVAPDATVLPIKQTNTQGDKTGTSDGLARAIDKAVDANAAVANVSVTTPNDSPVLKAAVAHAARRGMVIVAAAGNDGDAANQPAYPAAYSTVFPNVIAVSASDQNDQIAPFSETGNYVTVAAPGVNVPAIAGRGGYSSASGTSFATPYVTGTVALLKAAFPSMSVARIRNRLIATADAPPATVPDRTYGYGIVNPFLAVTTLRDDVPPLSPAASTRLLPPLRAHTPPNHHTRTLALGSAAVLLGLAVLAMVGAAVLRGRRRTPAHSR